ncbi:MAG TPA: Hsp20/alpha crystallin family protein [Pseudogracilibacillus sp.]|nr:Hsp20/alpha crystallin family protein [Pseudogracilibacillus sp.]
MHPMKPWNSNEHSIQRFRNEIDGMFSRLFNDSFLPTSSFWNAENSFTPKCNIEEKKDHYLVEVEIPGVEPKDVNIELEGNMLSIKGERKRESKAEDRDDKMHVVEQSYGSFYRSFSLPNNVNTEAIKAENKNGVLFIKIPKNKEKEPRRIDIK